MHYLYKIMALSLFLFTIHLSAQTQSDYTLESNQVSVFEKSESLTSTLTKTGNTLKWVQNINGTSNTIAYAIDQITGNWDANTSQGSLTYTLIKEGFTTITFNLTGAESGALEATLSVQVGDTPALQYSFNITNITYP
ncbi:MAG: hypothetical protein QM503_03405 [Bacteroidota bacterium]